MDILLSYLNTGLSVVIPFVLLLGILIFVHELGHFMVARWCGVRVEVFSLGFGKKILKVKRGDTVYALSLIPLGGYVKMFGEQPGDHIKEEDKAVSFTHKNVWQRIAIVIAGPLMNFFFAIFLFFIVAMTGESAHRPVVGDIKADSAAYRSGFRSGDQLLKINEQQTIESWEDFQKFLSLQESHDLNFRIQVQHEGSSQPEVLTVSAQAKPNPNILSRFAYVAEVDGMTALAKATSLGVPNNSPLYVLGLRTGDSIVSVNGKKVELWRDLEPRMAALDAKEPLTLEVSGIRDAEKEPKTFTLTLAPTKSITSYSLASLKVESSELYLARVMEKSPAEDAGLKAGDRILSINGQGVNQWEDVLNNIKSFDGKNAVGLLVRRGSEDLKLAITPKMSSQPTQFGGEEKRYTIGIFPYANLTDSDLISIKAANVGIGLSRGFSHTWDFSVMTVLSFVRLLENKISPKHIGGVLSIGQAASESFKMGFGYFLQMMALISVNLFVLNLLPIPVLDGGHLLFYIIEAVKGAPVSLKKMEIAQQVGLAILMSLMVFALFNDFTRFLGL